MYIEFFNKNTGSWLNACCDFEDCGNFENEIDAERRINELKDENPEIEFRLVK